MHRILFVIHVQGYQFQQPHLRPEPNRRNIWQCVWQLASVSTCSYALGSYWFQMLSNKLPIHGIMNLACVLFSFLWIPCCILLKLHVWQYLAASSKNSMKVVQLCFPSFQPLEIWEVSLHRSWQGLIMSLQFLLAGTFCFCCPMVGDAMNSFLSLFLWVDLRRFSVILLSVHRVVNGNYFNTTCFQNDLANRLSRSVAHVGTELYSIAQRSFGDCSK